MFFAIHFLNLEVFPQQRISLSIADAILADVFVNAGGRTDAAFCHHAQQQIFSGRGPHNILFQCCSC
jgi:hypothetical protein